MIQCGRPEARRNPWLKADRSQAPLSVWAEWNRSLVLRFAIHSLRNSNGVIKKQFVVVDFFLALALQLQPTDQFAVIASDGLWNVMTSDEVVEFVLEAKAEIDASNAGEGAGDGEEEEEEEEEPESEQRGPKEPDDPIRGSALAVVQVAPCFGCP